MHVVFVELLEPDVDDVLDELAARDSAPVGGRVRRPLREQLARNRAASIRAKGRFYVPPWAKVEPTDPAELERIRAKLDAERLETSRASRARIDECAHDFEHCEGGIDVCKLCRTWRFA
jgi:hypothetical protein